jgi:hypothetical protein
LGRRADGGNRLTISVGKISRMNCPCNRGIRFAATVARCHATLATKRTLLLNLGRTFVSPSERFWREAETGFHNTATRESPVIVSLRSCTRLPPSSGPRTWCEVLLYGERENPGAPPERIRFPAGAAGAKKKQGFVCATVRNFGRCQMI